MSSSTAQISISGRIDADSFIDLSLYLKKKGWSSSGGGYKPNGSLSLLVVIPEGGKEKEMIDELSSVIPAFDGVILSEDDMKSLLDFEIEIDEEESGAPPKEEEKWW